MLKKMEIDALVKLAGERGVDPAGLLAVCEVESAGRLFASVNGRQEPLIRFEGHYFYRLLGASKRNLAITRDLAHRRAGKVKNPLTQARRWKLLQRASAIDRDAALQSCSWGVGQVMGVHWRWLGFANVDALVSEARSGLTGQAELMLRFIDQSGLGPALAQGDWRGFARGYNGPAYASNRYDRKLAAAQMKYRRLLGERPETIRAGRHAPFALRFGDRGEAVAMLQKQLRAAGHFLKADGDFGPVTRAAVKSFQRSENITADGIAGPVTFSRLVRKAPLKSA